jgi:hypothetical protein
MPGKRLRRAGQAPLRLSSTTIQHRMRLAWPIWSSTREYPVTTICHPSVALLPPRPLRRQQMFCCDYNIPDDMMHLPRSRRRRQHCGARPSRNRSRLYLHWSALCCAFHPRCPFVCPKARSLNSYSYNTDLGHPLLQCHSFSIIHSQNRHPPYAVSTAVHVIPTRHIPHRVVDFSTLSPRLRALTIIARQHTDPGREGELKLITRTDLLSTPSVHISAIPPCVCSINNSGRQGQQATVGITILLLALYSNLGTLVCSC